MIPNNFNTGKYADREQRVKRCTVAGRKGAAASPWSKGHMVDSKSPRRGYVPRESNKGG